jgi:hypothetical protein
MAGRTMAKDLIKRSCRRRASADATLVVTTITLAVSLIIAVTTVSIGIARADTLVPVAHGAGG